LKGKLFGIGVGPGDPEMATIKAQRVLESSDVIAYPVRVEGEKSVALDIVSKIVDLRKKKLLEVVFSMDPDENVRRVTRRVALEKICDTLDKGNDVAMVTLGDVTLYSTFMRVDEEIRLLGFKTELVPGITSFSNGAAKAGISLVLGDESLAIVPSVIDSKAVGEALDKFDNVVIMKAFNSMVEIGNMLDQRGIDRSAGTVISCIGMDDEYIGPIDTGRNYGYFTTVLIKKENGGRA